ncbi:MAG: hypothetical protein Q9181_006767, partial [Wetmoreana brouardii]
MTTKVAVLLQYLRIFVPARNRNFYLTWSLVAVNLVINISLAFSFAFQCIPREKIWTPTLEGQCIDLGAAFLVSGITNTITDVAWAFLPFLRSGCYAEAADTLVSPTHSACIASIMRLVTVLPLLYTKDFAFHLSKPFLWALAEVTSGIVCVCVPVLPRLFRHLDDRIHSTWQGSTIRRNTPQQWYGGSSKRNTLDGRKPYHELDERYHVADRDVLRGDEDHESDNRGTREWDVERKVFEDGSIRKTVTIDQTSRTIG